MQAANRTRLGVWTCLTLSRGTCSPGCVFRCQRSAATGCGLGEETMRSLAGLATVLICATAAQAAAAQSLVTKSAMPASDADAQRLNDAAFAPKSLASTVDPSG